MLVDCNWKPQGPYLLCLYMWWVSMNLTYFFVSHGVLFKKKNRVNVKSQRENRHLDDLSPFCQLLPVLHSKKWTLLHNLLHINSRLKLPDSKAQSCWDVLSTFYWILLTDHHVTVLKRNTQRLYENLISLSVKLYILIHSSFRQIRERVADVITVYAPFILVEATSVSTSTIEIMRHTQVLLHLWNMVVLVKSNQVFVSLRD